MKDAVMMSQVIEIDGNILKCGRSVYQLGSVSSLELSETPPFEYPAWAVAGTVLCGCFFFGGIYGRQYYGPMFFAGSGAVLAASIVLFVYFAVILALVYHQNAGLKQYLMLTMDSGQKLIFTCQNQWFLEEAQQTLTESLDNRRMGRRIDFVNCSMTKTD